MDQLFSSRLLDTVVDSSESYALRLDSGRVEREQLYQLLKLRQELSELQEQVERLDNSVRKLWERVD